MKTELEIQIEIKTVIAEALASKRPQAEVADYFMKLFEENQGISSYLLSDSPYLRYVAKEVLAINDGHN
jgi:hypothetical protein